MVLGQKYFDLSEFSVSVVNIPSHQTRKNLNFGTGHDYAF